MTAASPQTARVEPEASFSLAGAAKSLPLSLATSGLLMALTALVNLFVTRYLVRELGVEAYGIAALANSFIPYLTLFVSAITASLFSFVAVEVHRGDPHRGNLLFNTGLRLLAGLAVLLALAGLAFSTRFAGLFDVPAGLEAQSNRLVALVLVAAAIGAVAGALQVPFSLAHRQYLRNLIQMAGRLAGAGALVACFALAGPRLEFIGASQILASALAVGLLYLAQRRIQRSLYLKRGAFDRQAGRAIARMSGWLILNELSTLLFLTAGYVLLNKTLGPSACGFLGPIMLIASLLLMLVAAVSDLLMPILFAYAGQGDPQRLRQKFFQSSRLVAFVFLMPVLAICGLGERFLEVWLGPEFARHWPLLWMIVLPLYLGGVAFLPSTHLYRAKNRVLLPALVNLACGVLHVAAAYLLIECCGAGLLGLGYSFVVFFGLRGLAVNTFYSLHLLEAPDWRPYAAQQARCVAVLGVELAAVAWIGRQAFVVSGPAAAVALMLIFFAANAWVLLTRQDRELLLALAAGGLRARS